MVLPDLEVVLSVNTADVCALGVAFVFVFSRPGPCLSPVPLGDLRPSKCRLWYRGILIVLSDIFRCSSIIPPVDIFCYWGECLGCGDVLNVSIKCLQVLSLFRPLSGGSIVIPHFFGHTHFANLLIWDCRGTCLPDNSLLSCTCFQVFGVILMLESPCLEAFGYPVVMREQYPIIFNMIQSGSKAFYFFRMMQNDTALCMQ